MDNIFVFVNIPSVFNADIENGDHDETEYNANDNVEILYRYIMQLNEMLNVAEQPLWENWQDDFVRNAESPFELDNFL